MPAATMCSKFLHLHSSFTASRSKIFNIVYCILYCVFQDFLFLPSASPNRVRYFRGRVSNFVQSEARKQSLLASGGGNLRPFPKYTVLYNYEKDIFGKGDRLHTVNLIVTSIMAYLVTSRGLEFASQLWLLSLIYQGAGKRPRQCCPKGPKTQETATRGPEGPESAQNTRDRGPEDEQSSVPVLALASATICFSRFGQKLRFSWHNLSTLMTAKMHENFSRVSYLKYKHRVKK